MELINLERLKEYMKEKNISEVKLAKLIGVSYPTVYRVFKGERKPGAKFIAGLLNSNLGLDYNEIFLNQPLPTDNTPQSKAG